VSDDLKELEERLDNPPLIWAPKGLKKKMEADKVDQSQRVVGYVEETDTRSGDFGPYPHIIIKRADGSRVAVAGFGTVLKNRLATVQVGDAVAIAYEGQVPSSQPGMQDYDSYAVVVRRDGKAVAAGASLAGGAFDDGDDLPIPDDD